MEIFGALIAVVAAIIAFVWGFRYVQNKASGRYVRLHVTLQLQGRQHRSHGRLLVPLFIAPEFLQNEVQSLVIRQVKIQSAYYKIRNFEQLVYNAEQPNALSVTCHLPEEGTGRLKLPHTHVVCQGVLYLKNGKKKPFYSKQAFVPEQAAVQA